jgi:hypothetical protein
MLFPGSCISQAMNEPLVARRGSRGLLALKPETPESRPPSGPWDRLPACPGSFLSLLLAPPSSDPMCDASKANAVATPGSDRLPPGIF